MVHIIMIEILIIGFATRGYKKPGVQTPLRDSRLPETQKVSTTNTARSCEASFQDAFRVLHSSCTVYPQKSAEGPPVKV